MRKKVVIAIIFVLFLGINYGFWKKTFSELGIEALTITGIDKNSCIRFKHLIQPTDLANKVYSVLSLHLSYGPKTKGNAFVEIYLNDELIEKKKVNEIAEWYRIAMPFDKLKEENTIKICGYTSKSISKIEIKRDSFIAKVQLADFSKKDSFEKKVNNILYINEPAKVKLLIKNYGSKEAVAKINLRKWKFEYAEIIETPKNLVVTIPKAKNNMPGEVTLEYKIMPKRLGKMALPKAILQYKSAFGDIVSVESTQPFIEVVAAERIIGFIKLSQYTTSIENTLQAHLRIKNIGEKEAKIVTLQLKSQNADINPNNFYITKLKSGQAKEFSFSIKPKTYGKVAIKCNAVTDKNKHFNCGYIEIFSEKPSINYQILLGGLAILLISLAYFYIFY